MSSLATGSCWSKNRRGQERGRYRVPQWTCPAEGVIRSGTSLSRCSHTAGSARRVMCSGAACPSPPPESATVAEFC